MPLWPNQVRVIDAVEAEASGLRRPSVVVGPTGSGKSRSMFELMKAKRRAITLLTHRRALLEQLANGLDDAGLRYGIRAAGYAPALGEPIQLCMVQTLSNQLYDMPAPHCDLLFIDEAHLMGGPQAMEIVEYVKIRDALPIGWTATALGIDHVYEHVIDGGSKHELREVGALLPCTHYAPDEQDFSKFRQLSSGEYSPSDMEKCFATNAVFGRVLEHWLKYNPDQLPSVLFGPTVNGSLFFAEQFWAAGIAAAHIDSKSIWVNGEHYLPNAESRQWLRELSRTGEIKIVCNRFVMREGVDFPWIYCAVLATAFGGLSSYLQAGGRILRAHESLDHVICIDHGGSWHVHGSLNSDRVWDLEETPNMITSERQRKFRQRLAMEPRACAACHQVYEGMPPCPHCGHWSKTRSRLVWQSNGQLQEVTGDIYKPRRQYRRPDVAERWKRMYFAGRNAGMTFTQCEAWFAKQHGWCWPGRDLPLMPKRERDWYLKVHDVPAEDLL